MLYLELRISVHLAWEQICPQGKYFYYKRYERLQELFLRGFHQALDFLNWREWGDCRFRQLQDRSLDLEELFRVSERFSEPEYRNFTFWKSWKIYHMPEFGIL